MLTVRNIQTGARVSFREPENGVAIVFTGTVREVVRSPMGVSVH